MSADFCDCSSLRNQNSPEVGTLSGNDYALLLTSAYAFALQFDAHKMLGLAETSKASDALVLPALRRPYA